jgi:hypothetical protein
MRYPIIVSALFLSLSFVACKKDSPNSSARAFMSVRLTDAPADYDQVNIDVQSVEIHTDGGGWQTLTTYNGIYDLLDLTNGFDTLIANDSIPAGTISQIRLVLGSNNTIMVDSVVYPLEVPSGYTSGLKINIHQVVTGGTAYTMLLDFDAGHSIVETGNGEYKLKPVIHGQLVSTVVTTATITGVVLPTSCTAFVSATNALDTASTYADAATGQFQLQNLMPGTYTFSVDAASPCNDTTFTLNVIAGPNAVDTVWVN